VTPNSTLAVLRSAFCNRKSPRTPLRCALLGAELRGAVCRTQNEERRTQNNTNDQAIDIDAETTTNTATSLRGRACNVGGAQTVLGGLHFRRSGDSVASAYGAGTNRTFRTRRPS
jgi:hypothetical protein